MKKGFTLVELSLAIALIGVLSIIIVLTIANAVSAYHRGLTLNQINTVGMGVVDDMRAALQSSPGRFSARSDCQAVYGDVGSGEGLACLNDGAMSFVFTERYARVSIGSASAVSAPVYGAFCTGAYSYIWNSGYFFNAEDYKFEDTTLTKAGFVYRVPSGSGTQVKNTYSNGDFKLLKVKDDNRAVCKAAAGAASSEEPKYLSVAQAKNELLPGAFNIACGTGSTANGPIEICGTIDEETIDTGILNKTGDLAFYDLTVARPAESEGTNSMFYSVSFILGTVRGGVDVQAQGNYCATPEGYNSAEDFDYCAINKFNFAAQATGG